MSPSALLNFNWFSGRTDRPPPHPQQLSGHYSLFDWKKTQGIIIFNTSNCRKMHIVTMLWNWVQQPVHQHNRTGCTVLTSRAERTLLAVSVTQPRRSTTWTFRSLTLRTGSFVPSHLPRLTNQMWRLSGCVQGRLHAGTLWSSGRSTRVAAGQQNKRTCDLSILYWPSD